MQLSSRRVTRITIRTAFIDVMKEEALAVQANDPAAIKEVLSLAQALPAQLDDTEDMQVTKPEISIRHDKQSIRVQQTITQSTKVNK